MECNDNPTKSFGSPSDIDAELIEANRQRIKQGARYRIAVVPAAVLVAWFVGFPLLYKEVCDKIASLNIIPPAVTSTASFFCSPGKQSIFSSPQYDEANRLILYGDATRPSRAEGQKAIYELDQNNRMYYGNYITALIDGSSYPKYTHNATLLEKALRDGELLEPDNSRYTYLLSSLMLQQACDLKKDGKGWDELIIKDRALLDKAMSEFLKAQNKLVFETYIWEMMRFRLSLLRASRNCAERTDKLAMMFGIVLPDLDKLRQLSKTSILYGQQLLSENRKEDAIPFLEACEPFSVKIINSSFTLIEELVGFSILGITERAIPLLEGAGENDRALEMKTRFELLCQPWEKLRDRNKLVKNSNAALDQKGGFLTSTLTPTWGGLPTEDEITYDRRMWYVVLERAGMIGFLRLFLILMLAMLLVTLRWRYAKGFSSAPILILAGGKSMAGILSASVVIPLAVYSLYTRYSGLSSHEYSLMYYPWWFATELAVLAWLITFLSVWLSVCYICNRCREVGMQMPPNISVLKLAVITLTPFGLLVWLSKGKKEGLFRGTVARSLIPVFASVVVLIGVAACPYLSWSERQLIENDTFTCPAEKGEGATRLESLAVQRLKKDFQDAMKMIEEGASGIASETGSNQ